MKKIILIPTYNERKNIQELVPLVFARVPDAAIMVIDDNSPDGTAGVVEAMTGKWKNLRLLKRKGKEGLGKAYIHAFREVLKDPTIEALVTMDADLSHNPEYLPEMLRRLEKSDIVVGSRYVEGGRTVGWELWRRVLSRGGNIYCRAITGMPIMDCTAGFNAIRTASLRKLDLGKLDLSGYAFIIELKYALYRSGARFSEVPILFVNRKGGESKMSGHIIGEGILAPWKMRIKR